MRPAIFNGMLLLGFVTLAVGLTGQASAVTSHGTAIGHVSGGWYGRGWGGYWRPPIRAVPRVDAQEAEVARAWQQMLDLEAQLRQSQRELSDLNARLNDAIDGALEVSSAAAAVNEALAVHRATEEAVMRKLQQRPEYQTAVTRHELARGRVQALRDDGSRTDRELYDAALQALRASAAVSLQERDARNADSEFVQSHRRLTQAVEHLRSRRQRLTEARLADPRWLAARQTLQELRLRLGTAQANLLSANKKLATAQAEREEALRHNAQYAY